jgi:hypothetical protein
VISNKLALTTFIAFSMIAIAAMSATTIVTQGAYAQPITWRAGTYCGTNYQDSFHVSPGFPSLSIPPGYPPWTPLCLPDNNKSPPGGFPISDH